MARFLNAIRAIDGSQYSRASPDELRCVHSCFGEPKVLEEFDQRATEGRSLSSILTSVQPLIRIAIFAPSAPQIEAWDTLRDAPHRQPHIAWMVAPRVGFTLRSLP